MGDPRVKGGKGYPIGVGWAGWCGLIFARGNTLRETLLLNLDLHLNVRADSASWERPPHDVTTDDEHPEPLGPADIMTWQSRRVALLRDDRGMVVDAVIANGDPIHPQWGSAHLRPKHMASTSTCRAPMTRRGPCGAAFLASCPNRSR